MFFSDFWDFFQFFSDFLGGTSIFLNEQPLEICHQLNFERPLNCHLRPQVAQQRRLRQDGTQEDDGPQNVQRYAQRDPIRSGRQDHRASAGRGHHHTQHSQVHRRQFRLNEQTPSQAASLTIH